MEEAATERSSRSRPPKSCKEEVSLLERSKPKMLTAKNDYCNPGNIRSSTSAFFWKLISKHTCLDILTRVFGYLITRVWICSLPGIKGHPCDPNEATQLVNYLMHY